MINFIYGVITGACLVVLLSYGYLKFGEWEEERELREDRS